MFGSLMTLASGVWHSLPSSASASGWRCAGVRSSGNAAMMRPERLMSRVWTSMPAGFVNARMIGRT